MAVAPGALVDPARLAPWLGEHAPRFEGPFTVRRIGAGQSCLTYLLEGGDWSAVLRRPPRGDLPKGAFDVLREHRIMHALRAGGAQVPVPETYGACADASVLGAPFYLMEHVEGAVLRDTMPAGTTDAQLRELGDVMVRTLVAVHATPAAEVGLGDLGRPEGFLRRQLERMGRQWERVRARDIPELDALGRWLAATVPPQAPASLVHGDYKLDNLIVGLPDSAEVRAVVDWELSTLGDALADLGWWLYFWLDPGEEEFAIPVCAVTDAPALPRRADIVERYAAATGRAVDDVWWYAGFGGWKITIIMETSFQRFRAGIADHPTFAALEDGVPMMARRALALARGGR
jgi:aminoglycoside phosphotransferase (APT) family kinase protein